MSFLKSILVFLLVSMSYTTIAIAKAPRGRPESKLGSAKLKERISRSPAWYQDPGAISQEGPETRHPWRLVKPGDLKFFGGPGEESQPKTNLAPSWNKNINVIEIRD